MDDTRSHELDEITLHRQTDVARLWELLMQPLGFGTRSVWLTFVDPDRRPVRALVEVAECDGRPTSRDVDNLFQVVAAAIDEQGPGHSVAMLLTRPGRGRLGADDRRLGRMLVAGARRYDVPLEPLHVATDVAVLPLAPDDLAA